VVVPDRVREPRACVAFRSPPGRLQALDLIGRSAEPSMTDVTVASNAAQAIVAAIDA
jgi:hypothetical protein